MVRVGKWGIRKGEFCQMTTNSVKICEWTSLEVKIVGTRKPLYQILDGFNKLLS